MHGLILAILGVVVYGIFFSKTTRSIRKLQKIASEDIKLFINTVSAIDGWKASYFEFESKDSWRILARCNDGTVSIYILYNGNKERVKALYDLIGEIEGAHKNHQHTASIIDSLWKIQMDAVKEHGPVGMPMRFAIGGGAMEIPDVHFNKHIIDHFDTDGDGYILYSEAELVTVINFMRNYNSSNKIESLESIEYFINLEQLLCRNNKLTDLDVSKNTALTMLGCSSNLLTSLDVSKNAKLTVLYCLDNRLTILDVSKNTELASLFCCYNQLTTLDVSKNIELTLLECDENKLTTLDVTKNIKLERLRCYNNLLTSLNVSKNIELTYLDCRYNKLTNLNISNNTALITLNCWENPIKNLDVSNNIALTYLNCHKTELADLDVSNNVKLTELCCGENQFRNLNLSKNILLTKLSCDKAILFDLDVSNNVELKELMCCLSQLTHLDISNNKAMRVLHCHYNQLSNLILYKNIALESLWCNSNQLTTLDVAKNTALIHINCCNNRLTTLDLSKNIALTMVICKPMPTLAKLIVKVGTDISKWEIPEHTEIVYMDKETKQLVLDEKDKKHETLVLTQQEVAKMFVDVDKQVENKITEDIPAEEVKQSNLVLDEKGEPIYYLSPLEATLNDLKSFGDLSNKDIVEVAESMIESIQENKSIIENEPLKGKTPREKVIELNEQIKTIEKADAEIAYWKSFIEYINN